MTSTDRTLRNTRQRAEIRGRLDLRTYRHGRDHDQQGGTEKRQDGDPDGGQVHIERVLVAVFGEHGHQ